MIRRHRNRPRTLLLLLAGALTVSLAIAAISSALPGDPSIINQAPANGASVPSRGEELKVTFTCPAYRTAEEEVEGKEGEETEEFAPVLGETYGVQFSTSPALGKDGRLTTLGFGEAGEGESEAVKGTNLCTSELALPTVPNPAALYQGLVYWQAYRECEECASGYETGPVSSFVLHPYVEEAEINFQNHLFGGYLTKVSFFALAELKGATVALQQWDGTAWTTIAAEPGTASGENSFFVKLGTGHKLLRADIVGTGVELPIEAKTRTFRNAKGTPAAEPIKPGTWVVANAEEQEEAPLTFRVTDDGTMLRGLDSLTEAFCRGPNKEVVTIPSTAALRAARIAPDGSVVGESLGKGATPTNVFLTGSFFDGRFTGEITSRFLNCAGFRQFEAIPKPKPKPKKK